MLTKEFSIRKNDYRQDKEIFCTAELRVLSIDSINSMYVVSNLPEYVITEFTKYLVNVILNNQIQEVAVSVSFVIKFTQ